MDSEAQQKPRIRLDSKSVPTELQYQLYRYTSLLRTILEENSKTDIHIGWYDTRTKFRDDWFKHWSIIKDIT
jgi:hypothetical protein